MRYVAFTITVVLAALTIPVSSAFACGRVINHKMDPEVQLVAEADDQLDSNSNRKAIRMLAEKYAHLRHEYPSKGKTLNSLQERAARVLAIATVRSEGKYTIDMDASRVKSRSDRRANLQWSHDILESMHEDSPHSATLGSYLAEAIVANGGSETKAYKLLKKYHDKNLIGEPQSLALLSELAKKRGKTKLAREVAERCEVQSGKASGVCPTFETGDDST